MTQRMIQKRTIIAATGSYLPSKILTNKDLEKIVDTTDDWIVQRTGIHRRHIAAEGETTADMAVAAGWAALTAGKFSPADIDSVIITTSTPDQTFPSVAVKVQAALGLPPGGMAFDLQAVCSGFVYGLGVANSLIITGQARRVLLIGSEKMSSILNWQDRGTCVLFGDGAAAMILEAAEGQGIAEDQGILSTHLHANGQLKDILYTTGGTSSTGQAGVIVMEGKEVFRHAVHYMSDVVEETLKYNDLKPEQIDWLVPHQANIRIIESTAKKLNMDMGKVILTVADHGNTSAASIPLAFDQAVRDGRIRRGHLVLMEALGAGLTWGAALIRY